LGYLSEAFALQIWITDTNLQDFCLEKPTIVRKQQVKRTCVDINNTTEPVKHKFTLFEIADMFASEYVENKKESLYLAQTDINEPKTDSS
jgi:hypothetical protein